MLPLLSYWFDIIKGRNIMTAASVSAADALAATYDLENINRLRAKAGKAALTTYRADDIVANCGEGVDVEQALVAHVVPPTEQATDGGPNPDYVAPTDES
jgi:hypothetical protein